jgi:hypothetical protein
MVFKGLVFYFPKALSKNKRAKGHFSLFSGKTSVIIGETKIQRSFRDDGIYFVGPAREPA